MALRAKVWVPIALIAAGVWLALGDRERRKIDDESGEVRASPTRDSRVEERAAGRSRDRRPAASAEKTGSLPATGSLAAAIHAVNECYRDQNCPFPQTDPRSYEYAVGQRMRRLLKEQFRRSQAEPAPFPEMSDVAVLGMRNLDAHVQDAALDILATLPPSEERMRALIDGLTNNPDPRLMERGVRELSRYLGTEWERDVQEFVAATIAVGPHFSAEMLSLHALSFINSSSYETYLRALRSMPASSQAAANLEAALQEFRRMRTGA